MADHTPLFLPGQAVTHHAKAAVTGGQLVSITGNREVSPAAAKSRAYGVAAFDAAIGDPVTVHTGGVHKVTASGAIAAGDQVEAAANGAAAKLTDGAPIGIALEAAASGSVLIDLR
ncbi:scaffolding protein [Gordonia phage Finkle]|uniref:Scaffolding protein n=1 Tax=Gordonia phage Finkle TaxID=2926099 RepID=A0A9E7NKI4_9CAUD|nr:scaffolding protein [Gordonia phage Finkle]UTN92924.1 scaffolding protein [Gordonia phage Finkle]